MTNTWPCGTPKSSGNAFDWREGREPFVSKEHEALEKKRAYERAYNKRRYAEKKAAQAVEKAEIIGRILRVNRNILAVDSRIVQESKHGR